MNVHGTYLSAHKSAGRGMFRTAAVLLLTTLALAGTAHAQQADVVLNHTDDPDPGPRAGVFTYTLRVTNNSTTDAASGVALTAVLPEHPVLGLGSVDFIDFVQTAGSARGCDITTPPGSTPADVSCAVGTLAAQDEVIFDLRVRLNEAAVYQYSGSIASDNDPNAGNNTHSDTTTVNASADLVMNAEATDTGGAPIVSVSAGEPFQYRLSVDNDGPDPTEAGGRVRVRFTVPVGTAVTGTPSGSGWSCDPSSGYPLAAEEEIACERTGTLAVSATTPQIVVPAVSNVGTGGGSNIAAAFAVDAFRAGETVREMPDPDMSNNSATVNLSSGLGSDLGITKAKSSPGGSTIAIGSAVTFTLSPRFEGGLPPSGTITVTDTLPANFTGIGASGTGWSCGVAGQTVTCTRTDGAGFDNFSDLPQIAITATASTAGTGIVNTATISGSDQPDPNDANDSGSTGAIAISNDADLRLLKSSSLNPVLIGQSFSYTLNVRNNGPLGVPNGQTITVVDTPPSGVTIQSASASGWSCVSSTGSFPHAGDGVETVSCARSGGLGSGSTSNISLPAQITGGTGTYTNNACVSLETGAMEDSNASNDCDGVGVSASGDVSGGGADLVVASKTAAPNPVRSGDELTYVVTVRNDGPVDAGNVEVRDHLTGLVSGGFVSATPSQGTCPASLGGSNPNLVCNLGTLANGASATVTIVVRPVLAATGNRSNTANVLSLDDGDPDHSNNSGSVTSVVEAVAAIEVAKTNDPDPVRAGEPVTYTVTVRNPDGPSSAADVEFEDTLPTNAAFVELVTPLPSGTNCTPPAAGDIGGTLSCTMGSIGSSGQKAVQYRVRPIALAVDADYTGYELINTVSASTSTQDASGEVPDPVSATTTTAVTEPELDVLINKSDTPDPVPLGEVVRYTIRIDNDGPSWGTNPVMTDTFPTPGSEPSAEFSYQGNLSVSNGGVCDEPAIGALSGVLVCTWPELAGGGFETVEYDMVAERILIPGEVTGTGFNAASVAVDEEETTLANNEVAINTTTRQPEIPTDLALTKQTAVEAVRPGEQVEWTLTVRNNGPEESRGAQVVDVLPAGLEFVSAEPDCSASGESVICALGTLAVDEERAFTILTLVSAEHPGGEEIVNVASVQAPGDTDPSNNEDESTVMVIGHVEGIPVNHPFALLATVLGFALLLRYRRAG